MPHTDLLTLSLTLLGAALAAAWILKPVRAPSFIGYLLAGILIGPSGAGLVAPEQVAASAEIGLVLLLFCVGLELSPEPLLRLGWQLLTAALLQIGLTAAATSALLVLLLKMPLLGAAVVGVAIACSCTSIVLKQLSEQRELQSSAGTITVGILLVQDLVTILVLLVLPMTTGDGPQRSGLQPAMTVVALLGCTLLARLTTPTIVDRFFRWSGPEFMTLFAVVAAAGGAWTTTSFGWSPALGAFIVGLMLALTDVQHQVFAEISPLRDVFYALFFVSIGTVVDLEFARQNAPALGGALVLILLGKLLLTMLAIRAARWPLRLSLQVGLSLCTISEFSYVLGLDAARIGALQPSHAKFLTACVVGSMLLGAMTVPVAGPLAAALAAWRRPRRALPPAAHSASPVPHAAGHVVIVGYGLNGQNLARVLSATGIAYCVIEYNRNLAKAARAAGGRVVVGDATRLNILQHAGIESARALVVCINDALATRRVVLLARQQCNALYILARTRYVSEVDALYRSGANQVIPEEFETSIEVFSHVLKEFGVPDNVVDAQIGLVRGGRYAMLRGLPVDRTVRSDVLRLLESAATQTHMLEPGSAAAGRTLRELNLRAATSVTVIAIVREGQPTVNPSAEFALAVGDVLVMVGAHRALNAARALLVPPATPRTSAE